MDAKTKTQLDDYKRKKKAREMAARNGGAAKDDKKEDDLEEGEESGEIVENGDDDTKEEVEVLDENTLREDRVAKAGLDAIMREYSADLAKAPPSDSSEEKKQKKISTPSLIPKDVKEDGVSSLACVCCGQHLQASHAKFRLQCFLIDRSETKSNA